MSKGFKIAIDGPMGSGKGTIAAKLAAELQGFHLYTGAMYRSVALACIQQGFNLQNPEQIIPLLTQLQISFKDNKVFLNDTDVTERIKEKDTAEGGSVVGVYPEVRKYLVQKQQQIAEEKIKNGQSVISEGRDTGTVVFPKADLKIFLTASPEVRAKRRFKQYQEQGREVDFTELLKEIEIRDNRDTQRETDPLTSDPEASGYFILDNSTLNEEDTVNAIKSELKKKGLIL